jgi:tetratricopeptide (TPR) repeat protein
MGRLATLTQRFKRRNSVGPRRKVPGSNMIYAVPIREPYISALDNNRPDDVADGECEQPEDLYARGLARGAVGRTVDARADFETASQAGGLLEDACRLEIAYLDVRNPGGVATVAATARQIAEKSPRPSKLAARAFHIAGLAEYKAGNSEAAVDQLLDASKIYQDAECEAGRAQVLDTLGMVQAARGRLDDAIHHYALSLAANATLGDREGIAVSLGNMGRVELQAGRFERAIDCFRADLQIAQQIHDQRGIARVLNDIGRAQVGLGEHATARDALQRSLELAGQHAYRDIEFFVLKDLVLTDVAAARLEDAHQWLNQARHALPADAEAYFHAQFALAEGVWLAANESPEAIPRLRAAVENFDRLSLPDDEIAARIELAKALLAANETRDAEQCLLRAVESVRSRGLLRFLPLLNEIMTQLDIVDGAVEEKQRSLGHDAALGDQGYLIRGHLGSGAFGDVFRVYDAQRAQEAALKVLRLADVYDPQLRQRLINSARAELQATAQIRHPGIVRVLAIGTLSDGREYVLQEFVPGRSLRQVLKRLSEEKQISEVHYVLSCLAEIAFALAALHEVGVIHRDLKPDNIVLRDNRRPVLLDFGIAYVPKRAKPADARIVGTLPYMSPEQLLGSAVDNRSDLYSLGVIAYEWLGGSLPLEPHGATFFDQIRDLATRAPAPISERRHEIPESVASLVMELLEKSPRQRPANAIEVAHRCNRLLSTLR